MCLYSHSITYLQTSGSTFPCPKNSIVLLVKKKVTAHSVKCGCMKTVQFDPILADDGDLTEFRKILKILRMLGSSRKEIHTDTEHCKFYRSSIC